jgi:drug/metabolite transporter, DME family
LLILFAGVLWSLSGLFVKAMTTPTFLGMHDPPVDAGTMAFYRVFFAAVALSPGLVRAAAPKPSLALLLMVASFAIMNLLFVRAMAEGTAAGAILLQYTAPVWLLLAGVFWLGEKVESRDLLLLIAGLTGITILVAGNWSESKPAIVACAFGSGITYAGVLLGLRFLRGESSVWLTVCNFTGSALVALPLVISQPVPRPLQLLWLALFGIVQLALPYWLMARGLRHVSSLEAGLLTLVEPVLNPLWAFLVSPEKETPSFATILGGAVIVGSLVVRYWPTKTPSSSTVDTEN